MTTSGRDNDKLRQKGLSAAEVEDSRLRYGTNVFTPVKGESLWKRLLTKFAGPLGRYFGIQNGDSLVFILEVIALISIVLACAQYWGWMGLDNPLGRKVFLEPAGIIIAILLATVIAFVFEHKAGKEFAILNSVNDDLSVNVIRDGNATRVARRDIVVGDIVLLAHGDEVPADGELLEAVSLIVDESSLTGEPMTHKSLGGDRAVKPSTYPADRVYRGTKVMEGHGVFRVTAVGDSTENGKVMRAVQIDDSVRTPLNEQLDKLSSIITRASYLVALLFIALRFVLYYTAETTSWVSTVAYALDTFMVAVSLIVMAVPEGLPMAVNLSLAYSMRRMLKSGNLVRRMHACETMGAATVICTDKTGTLTQNRMQVARTRFLSLDERQRLGDDEASRLIAEAIAVNTTAQLDLADPASPQPLGNPTEGALLLWLHGNGIDYREGRSAVCRMAEIPFSTERKFMATVVTDAEGEMRLHVKGAPELILRLCAGVGQDVAPLLEDYQRHAMRTLAFACLPIEKVEDAIVGNELVARRLRLLGVVAISDPVRPEVPPAIAECRQAGIKIKIVTGDTALTAREVAREIGLWNDELDDDSRIITGAEFEALGDDELLSRVDELKIIARARPMDKKRLVEILQAKGEVVAVTGDGTNDAPALNAAHVGISMGDGTGVAKEASDITIIDNSFAGISKAVNWGRSLYRNIQRFLLFQLTVNVVACAVVIAGVFMDSKSPLTVIQILWVNLIMDTFAAMALASLPPTSGVMRQRPRDRRHFIINRAMTERIFSVGALFVVILIPLIYYLENYNIGENILHFSAVKVGHHHFSTHEYSLFFTFFVMMQFWNLFNAKSLFSRHAALRGIGGCKSFLFISAVILAGQILIVELGGDMFNVCPLPFVDWLIIIASTSAVLIFPEAYRFYGRRVKSRLPDIMNNNNAKTT